MLAKSDYKPVPKAWAPFVVQTLEGTCCTTKIPIKRVHIIAAILEGAPININELVRNNIQDFATENYKTVGHSIIICWLCEEAKVDQYTNDFDAPTMKPITDKVTDAFIKEFDDFMRDQVQRAQQGGEDQPL